jgi:hypothetical protein
MHTARFRGEGERLFKDGVLASLRNNRKLTNTILSGFKPVYLTSKAGIITAQLKL